VDEETDRLNHLVSDAIEMSRIEAGGFQLNLAPTDLGLLLERVLRQMKSRLTDREVRCVLEAGLPGACLDADLVELALRQLVDNAVKYSPQAAPLQVGAARRDGAFVLWVADRGPGVAPKERARLFERFYRASTDKDGVPGSGLGLFVVREIARAHGGDAALVDSSDGARFEITLPVETAEHADR